MRRIIVSMNVTLDGFIADVHAGLDWQFSYWSSDMGHWLSQQLSRTDTLLLGRNTYQAMAAYWPKAVDGFGLSRDDMAYAVMMNDYPKIVCSSTLTEPGWKNSRIIKAGVITEVKKLKQQAGKDIMVYGSNTLVQCLNQNQLIDEFQLWIYPVALGRGLALFKQQQALCLISSNQFASGVVVATYKIRN